MKTPEEFYREWNKSHNEFDIIDLMQSYSDYVQEQRTEVDDSKCSQCGGRTALVTGNFYYEPDKEPYKNGLLEVSKVDSGDCYIHGYICDDCLHPQLLWSE